MAPPKGPLTLAQIEEILTVQQVKGVSCYGASDAVLRVIVYNKDTSNYSTLPENPTDNDIEIVRLPDNCQCDRECYKACKIQHFADYSVFIYDGLRAGSYKVQYPDVTGLLNYIDTNSSTAPIFDEDTFEIKESIKLETFGKPATAPWDAKDGAIEGVVYGTSGKYRVSLYVGYEFASLSSLADAAAVAQGEARGAPVPGSITALIGKNEEFVSNFLSRYTAAYSVNTWVDDANGGRFAFGALKPGQYTVVVEADARRGNDADEDNVWVQSATATVKVGVDYVATAFRLLALVVSLSVFTWLFRHLYSLLIDILDDLLPKFVK
jgi:hypothetical protein